MATVASIVLAIVSLVWSGQTRSLPDTAVVAEFTVGSFEKATRCLVDPWDRYIVSDDAQNAVLLFDDVNRPPRTIGGYGWGESAFDKPAGIATDGINFYVCDENNHRIQRFDRQFRYLSSLSTRDTSVAAARFGYPTDVALSPAGDLFVLDGENTRVVKFQATTQYERTFGDVSSGVGRLRNPIRLLVNDNMVFVAEHHRIVAFDVFGNYIRSFAEQPRDPIVALTFDGEGILAVTQTALLWYTTEGDLKTSIPFATIVTDRPLTEIRDVAVRDARLVLLTEHSLHFLTLRR